MSKENIGVADQEGKSMAQHLASAERELSAFVTAVHQLFGPEQARYAADNWMEELEQTDWISEAQAIDWRAVTIAAAARLVGRDKEARANHMKKDNHECPEPLRWLKSKTVVHVHET
jgi:hypothetical protein